MIIIIIAIVIIIILAFWFIRKQFVKCNRLDENYHHHNVSIVNYTELYRQQLSSQRHSTVLVKKSTIHGYITEHLYGDKIIFSLEEGEQRSARDHDGYGMRHILYRHQKDLGITSGKELIDLLKSLRLDKISEEIENKIALYYDYDYYKKNHHLKVVLGSEINYKTKSRTIITAYPKFNQNSVSVLNRKNHLNRPQSSYRSSYNYNYQ
jgi:hypothetical protein